MRKPGSQKGSVRIKDGRWYGSFFAYGRHGGKKRHEVPLGKEGEMTEVEARAKVFSFVQQNNKHMNAMLRMHPVQHSVNAGFGILDSTKPGARGTIGELVVSAELLSRGYEVYKPISNWATCDLLYMHEGVPYKVEVKMCASLSGEVHVGRNLGKFDILAVVDAEMQVHYISHSEMKSANVSIKKLKAECPLTAGLTAGI